MNKAVRLIVNKETMNQAYGELRDCMQLGPEVASSVLAASINIYSTCRGCYRMFNLLSDYGNLNARTMAYLFPERMNEPDMKARIAKCADLVVACRETGIPVELQQL